MTTAEAARGQGSRQVHGKTGQAPAGLPVRSLTILYDELCPFCIRCADWLSGQRCLLPVHLLGRNSPEAQHRFGSLPSPSDELTVVDDVGRIWVGPEAFLMSMWATARYRSLSFTLSQPGMISHARRFFESVSRNRGRLGTLFGEEPCDRCSPGQPETVR